MLAEQCLASAQYKHGFMYANGRFMYANGQGVPQDQVHMWFNLAGAQGHDYAAENQDSIAKGTPESRPSSGNARFSTRSFRFTPERGPDRRCLQRSEGDPGCVKTNFWSPK